LCEFALSYDGGNTYTKIATYHKTCPDIFFTGWKVKIPDNAPSCDNAGKCIFSWSWINAIGNREFYQGCADIKIVGNSTKALPIIDITKANFPPLFNKIITPDSDGNTGNSKGSGPLAEDVKANLKLKIGDKKPKRIQNPLPSSTSDSVATQTETTPTETSTTPDTATPTETSDSKTCNINGSMTCVQSGTKPEFDTCDNGKIITRKCPGVLVCQSNNDDNSISCAYPSRKS